MSKRQILLTVCTVVLCILIAYTGNGVLKLIEDTNSYIDTIEKTNEQLMDHTDKLTEANRELKKSNEKLNIKNIEQKHSIKILKSKFKELEKEKKSLEKSNKKLKKDNGELKEKNKQLKVSKVVNKEKERASTPPLVARGNQPSGKVLTMHATAYTAYCQGCSGKTATGVDLRSNPGAKIIATDPSVIPLGTKVHVEGYGYAVAGDVGGGIKGMDIDVFIPDLERAVAYGNKSVKVTILE